MALLFAEDTVTFITRTQPARGDGTVEVPAEGESNAVTGQLHTLTAQTAFERYGVELDRPVLFLLNREDAGSIAVGMKATKGSRTFEVRVAPFGEEPSSELSDLDYMECILEERQF